MQAKHKKRFVVTLTTMGGEDENKSYQQLKQFLKRCGRSLKLQCIDIVELPADATPSE